jgi:glycosyltransferase involved in cell wall biosynthesis
VNDAQPPPHPPHPRPRVLLVASECNPEWVSTPLVGWSLSKALREVTDAHLVTQVRNREAMLRAGLREGVDFTSIDSEAVARRAYNLALKLRGGAGKGWTVGTAISALTYPYFEKLLWDRFGRRIAAGEFALVHRVTPMSPTVPSTIAARVAAAGVPFVLGPLAGGVPWPRGFDDARRAENEHLSYVRSVHRLLPDFRSTRRNAAAIFVASRDAYQQIPRDLRRNCFYLPENAIDPARFTRRRTRRAGRPLRCVFLGRLVPYKGADMLLEAAAPLLRAGAMTLAILGDGPQMPLLRQIVTREKMSDVVRLAGWVEHGRVQDFLADADLFTFPSIREFGGAVALEAMAVGLVPLVVDYGGLGELVTEKTGYLLPIGTRPQIIDRLRTLLTRLCDNPAEIDARSPLALRRAHEQFTWRAKAAQVVQVYDWLLGRRPDRPHFPMPTPDLE